MSNQTPRCMGQKCYKRDGCKTYLDKGNGFVEQHKPFRCTHFVPLLEMTPRQKLLSLTEAA